MERLSNEDLVEVYKKSVANKTFIKAQIRQWINCTVLPTWKSYLSNSSNSVTRLLLVTSEYNGDIPAVLAIHIPDKSWSHAEVAEELGSMGFLTPFVGKGTFSCVDLDLFSED